MSPMNLKLKLRRETDADVSAITEVTVLSCRTSGLLQEVRIQKHAGPYT